MKKKLGFFLLLCCMMCCGFIACGRDKDRSNNNSVTDGTYGQDTTTPVPTIMPDDAGTGLDNLGNGIVNGVEDVGDGIMNGAEDVIDGVGNAIDDMGNGSNVNNETNGNNGTNGNSSGTVAP